MRPRALALAAPVILAAVISLPGFAEEAPGSLSLHEALALATSRSPRMGIAEAQHQAAVHGAREAKSGRFPQVHLSAGYTRFQEPSIVTPIHEAGRFPPLDDDIYEGTLQMTFPVFDGGRIRSAQHVATAAVRGSQAQLEITTASLLREVGVIYVRSGELADRKVLLQARLKALRERQAELRALHQEGRAAEVDLAQLRSEIERIRSDSLDVELAAYELSRHLGRSLGVPAPVRPLPATGEDRTSRPEFALPTANGEYLEGPSVRLAQALTEAAEARRDQSSAAFWPQIGAFAGYSLRAGDDLEATGEWLAGVSVTLPLFDAGRRRASLRAAEAGVQNGKEQLRMEQQSESAQLDIAIEQRRASLVRSDHLAAAVEAQAFSVSAHQKLFEDGRVPLSELLTQETQLLTVQMERQAVLASGAVATLEYYNALGLLTPVQVESIVGSLQ